MKILIINTSDISGGAARAAYRLHKALRTLGIESWMLAQNKVSDDYTIIGPETKIQKAIAKIRQLLDQLPVKFYKYKTKTIFSPAWLPFSGIVKKINNINPDIVHLHWICGGMLRIEDLVKIRKPIVWSLHDMWAFTGGCHYDEFCGAYKNRCGNCKILNSNKSYDLSTWIWNRKRKVFLDIKNLTIIGLSKWLVNSARESALLKNNKVINLPNPLDTNLFKTINKKIAREILSLPQNKKLILFGAINPLGDPRKGFKELKEALDKLKETNIELVVFGSSLPKSPPKFKYKTHYLGQLEDDVSLVVLYNAANVTVVPSLQENLSNTIMESLSCGTPVVAFDVGGNSDMIDHKINGYLAKPFDIVDLANGIEWVLNHPNYEKLCQNAREKVVKCFDSRIIAKKYIELYKEILTKS